MQQEVKDNVDDDGDDIFEDCRSILNPSTVKSMDLLDTSNRALAGDSDYDGLESQSSDSENSKHEYLPMDDVEDIESRSQFGEFQDAHESVPLIVDRDIEITELEPIPCDTTVRVGILPLSEGEFIAHDLDLLVLTIYSLRTNHNHPYGNVAT
jgi:hypothetical protein